MQVGYHQHRARFHWTRDPSSSRHCTRTSAQPCTLRRTQRSPSGSRGQGRDGDRWGGEIIQIIDMTLFELKIEVEDNCID